jgi:hypothetical protein
MTKTEQILDALILANPFVLLARYDDDLAHCVEASAAATMALQARGVKARLMPCAVVAQHPNHEAQGSIGLHPREIYGRVNWGEEARQPYEEWLARQWLVKPEGVGREHIVIEVRDTHTRYLVDLTIGQLHVLGIPMPLQVKTQWDNWPDLEVRGTRIRYEKFRGTRELDPASYKPTGFRDDYLALMDLALRCGLDIDRFLAAVDLEDPGMYATVVGRLTAKFGQ